MVGVGVGFIHNPIKSDLSCVLGEDSKTDGTGLFAGPTVGVGAQEEAGFSSEFKKEVSDLPAAAMGAEVEVGVKMGILAGEFSKIGFGKVEILFVRKRAVWGGGFSLLTPSDPHNGFGSRFKENLRR